MDNAIAIIAAVTLNTMLILIQITICVVLILKRIAALHESVTETHKAVLDAHLTLVRSLSGEEER